METLITIIAAVRFCLVFLNNQAVYKFHAIKIEYNNVDVNSYKTFLHMHPELIFMFFSK